MLYERVLKFPRLLKTSIALMHVTLFWLSYHIITGGLDNVVASGALVVSGFWLGLTAMRLGTLLRSYFDHLSRLQIMIPTVCGALLAVLAIFSGNQHGLTAVAVLELIGWLAVFINYRKTRASYIEQDHGPLPKNAWVNPSHEALRPGDLILTNGRMTSRYLHDSLGHAEVVLADRKGRLHTLTAYMETGVRINRAEDVTRKLVEGRDHFVVMRLLKPLTDEQMRKAPGIAVHLRALNQAWTKRTNERRARIISYLPLPKSFKAWLTKKTHATGYDWAGLFIGTSAKDHWTCIAVSVEFLHQLNVPIGTYGTGMLGLGTGLLDPIQPVRLLGDKAYRLLDLNDKARFEAFR